MLYTHLVDGVFQTVLGHFQGLRLPITQGRGPIQPAIALVIGAQGHVEGNVVESVGVFAAEAGSR